ncbi:sulfotransferase [Pelagibacteraceae bacterium]|nr:sulfotransferase [Pelagibacteraceae bacterium]
MLKYNLLIKEGIKNASNNDFKKAEINFINAINNNKKKYQAYLNLSNTYVIQNKEDEAVELLIDYIKKQGFNEFIANHAGMICLKYNLNILVKKLFRACKSNLNLKSKKNNYLFYIQGMFHNKERNFNKAKNSFIESISNDNYFFNSYVQLFNLLEKINQLKLLKYYIDLGYNNFKEKEKIYVIYLYHAIYLNRENKFKDSQKIFLQYKLEEKLKNNKNYLYKLLDIQSKNYEKLKKYNIAFKTVLKRNKITINRSENKVYDRSNIIDTIEVYKKFYTNENYLKITNRLNYLDDSKLVFLVGFPRSGTTLLDSILRSHSSINVLEEKPFLLDTRHEYFKKNKNNITEFLNISQNEKDFIRKSYYKKIMDTIKNKNKYKKIIIDKLPLSIIEIGFIKCIFPNSKIILAMRHPCDVITSCLFSSFKINDAMINFLNINHTIDFYNKVFDLFEHYEKEFNLQYLTIKYEDVVTNFKSNINKIFKYIDVKYEKDVEKFYITAQKRNKIYTPSYTQVINPLYQSSIARWKNYTVIKNSKKNLDRWIKKFKY